MPAAVRVVAVNIATALRRLPGGHRSGIGKQPVAGAVAVGPLGLAGDHIGSSVHHGGPDQAVYLYAADDAAWWSARLQRAIGPGFFGENLTLERWWDTPRVGDVLHFAGGLALQLTFPRIPCGTLAAQVGAPGFVKDFAAANRSGHYARVLTPGAVAAGDVAQLAPAPVTAPALAELFAAWHDRRHQAALLRAALDAPIAERARRAIEGWTVR